MTFYLSNHWVSVATQRNQSRWPRPVPLLLSPISPPGQEELVHNISHLDQERHKLKDSPFLWRSCAGGWLGVDGNVETNHNFDQSLNGLGLQPSARLQRRLQCREGTAATGNRFPKGTWESPDSVCHSPLHLARSCRHAKRTCFYEAQKFRCSVFYKEMLILYIQSERATILWAIGWFQVRSRPRNLNFLWKMYFIY